MLCPTPTHHLLLKPIQHPISIISQFRPTRWPEMECQTLIWSPCPEMAMGTPTNPLPVSLLLPPLFIGSEQPFLHLFLLFFFSMDVNFGPPITGGGGDGRISTADIVSIVVGALVVLTGVVGYVAYQFLWKRDEDDINNGGGGGGGIELVPLPYVFPPAGAEREALRANNLSCMICLEEFAVGETLRRLPCGVILHGKCAENNRRVFGGRCPNRC